MKGSAKTSVFYSGLALFLIGIVLRVFLPDATGALAALTYMLLGFGAGIIGVGAVYILQARMHRDDPLWAKQKEIEEKDERNIRIREKSGYTVWYISIFMLAALVMATVILGQGIATWLAMAVLLIHCVSYFVLMGLNNKKY